MIFWWTFNHKLSYLSDETCEFQVQLRLQQVVNAPSERREDLLKELEHFAFRGIPNLNSPRPVSDGGGGDKDAPEAKKGDEDTRQPRRWSTSSSEHESKVQGGPSNQKQPFVDIAIRNVL